MKEYSGNVGANYHFLFFKEFISQIKNQDERLRAFVRKTVSDDVALKIGKSHSEQQKVIMLNLFNELSKEEWAKAIIERITTTLLQKTKQLYEFQTQRNYFLVENFRESCSQPITKSKITQAYNLNSLFKVSINKQLRRTIWSKSLLNETNKFQFFQFDHKITPYNLTQELSIGLLKLSQENQIKVKENQKDCYLRLLQYLIKKWDKIPNISQQHLALNVIDVYAHFTPNRMYEIGSVFVGLNELAEFYFEESVEKRLEYLNLAFELVDPETFQLIQKHYLRNSQKAKGCLNQCFEKFRLTLSCAFLPFQGSQYLIDQLLIKRRNKLDIYIGFALMTMIMSDDLQELKEKQMELTEVISAVSTKKVIKLEDVVDSFRVVYQNIDPYHFPSQQSKIQNRLLGKLIEFDQLYTEPPNSSSPIQTANQKIATEKKIEGFVVEDKNTVLRLGTKSNS